MIPTKVLEPDNTLIPVWFLSYRKGNRIAYATINGESGKIVTDTPVAIWKVWLMALVMAVPIFFGLNFCMTFVPSIVLVISMAMLVLTNIVYYYEMEKIITREKNINYERAKRAASRKEKNDYDNEEEMPKKKFSFKTIKKIGCMIPSMLFAVFMMGSFAYVLFDMAIDMLTSVIWLPMLIVMTLLPIFGYNVFKKEPFFHAIYYIVPTITGIISAFVFKMNPISDAQYYIAVILNLLAMLLVLTGIWRALNILTTRPLPQLQKRGGDSYEK